MTEEIGIQQERIYDLQDKLVRVKTKLQDLATMGALVTSIRDLDTILSVVMEMSIRMVEVEVGLIQVVMDNELTSKVTWGLDDSVIDGICHKDGRNISRYCFDTREPVIIDKNSKDFTVGSNVQSLLAMPINSRSNCYGTVIVINKESGEPITDDDRENLEMLINFAAVAIDNANLMEQSLTKQKMEQELYIARQVQQAILPDIGIELDGIDFGIVYTPARSVGGDFYDVIKINDDEFYIVIGDVTNKGTPAAMLMSATMAIIRSEIERNKAIDPAELSGNLNSVLCTGVIKSNDMFVTLHIARYNLKKHVMLYCNAGHNPPYFYDSGTGEISLLNDGGTFVGQFADIQYILGKQPIKPGDRVLAYTDGVTEAENVEQIQFGSDRLEKAFVDNLNMKPQDFCDLIKDWVDRYTEGAGDEAFDDITIIELAVNR